MIDCAPRNHKPATYRVYVKDRRGHFLDVRYVRASSRYRAELTGAKVNRYVFGKTRTASATAALTE